MLETQSMSMSLDLWLSSGQEKKQQEPPVPTSEDDREADRRYLMQRMFEIRHKGALDPWSDPPRNLPPDHPYSQWTVALLLAEYNGEHGKMAYAKDALELEKMKLMRERF